MRHSYCLLPKATITVDKLRNHYITLEPIWGEIVADWLLVFYMIFSSSLKKDNAENYSQLMFLLQNPSTNYFTLYLPPLSLSISATLSAFFPRILAS